MRLDDLGATPVLPGETLAGKYRVERILGRGGMGVVVAARHLELEERVAIKFLLRGDDPLASERFAREARAAAKVKSEHVCRVHDVGRLDTGEAYLVMEYLDGQDLAARITADGLPATASVARWIIEACVGLAEAHALGIVHRDLKPANLFVAKRADGSEHVKILDFGISKLPSSEEMTRTSATMGTPIYMSPEQVVSARDVDRRTDVWSLGVILYELLSGKKPFGGDTLLQLSVQIREAAPAPLDGVPDALAAVVMRCLEKEPAARFATAGELAAALAPFADGEGSRLAQRLVPSPPASSPTASSPLAATLPEARPKVAPPVTPVSEQITLEPTSHASGGIEGGPKSGGARTLVGLALAGVAVLAFVLLARNDRPVVAPDATASAPSIPLSLVDAATVSLPPEPRQDAGSPEPEPPPVARTPAPRAFEPKPVRAVASAAPSPAVPPATAPPSPERPAPSAVPSSPPPSDPAVPKRRSLDRSDPYGR